MLNGTITGNHSQSKVQLYMTKMMLCLSQDAPPGLRGLSTKPVYKQLYGKQNTIVEPLFVKQGSFELKNSHRWGEAAKNDSAFEASSRQCNAKKPEQDGVRLGSTQESCKTTQHPLEDSHMSNNLNFLLFATSYNQKCRQRAKGC